MNRMSKKNLAKKKLPYRQLWLSHCFSLFFLFGVFRIQGAQYFTGDFEAFVGV